MVLLSFESFGKPNSASFQVIYTANRAGEIGPCGCQVNQIGGLDRFFTLVDAERSGARGPLFVVDSGDTFFSAPQIPASRKDFELRRAELIAASYRLIGIDVFTPGDRDLALGLDFLHSLQKKSGMKVLSINLTDEAGKPLFDPYAVIEKNGIRLAFIGVSGEDAFSIVDGVKAQPVAERFREILSEIKEKRPQKIFVLSHLGLAKDRELAKLGEELIIFGSHSLDPLPSGEKAQQTTIFQPLHEGQQAGILSFQNARFEARLEDLGKEWDKDNAVSQLVRNFQQQSSDQENRRTSSHKKRDDGFVAHPFECRKCHEKQHDFWASTKHASAYLVLYSKKQHFDPECIGCHSLGYQKPEGFQTMAELIQLNTREKNPFAEQLMKKVFSIEKNVLPLDSRKEPGRYQLLQRRYHQEIEKLEKRNALRKIYLGIQCEHCHGNRHGHPGSNTQKKVNVESCKMCHRPPNVAHFDPADIQKIACPLMDKESR